MKHIQQFHNQDPIFTVNSTTNVTPSDISQDNLSISSNDSPFPDNHDIIGNQLTMLPMCNTEHIEGQPLNPVFISNNSNYLNYVNNTLQFGRQHATKLLICKAAFQKMSYTEQIASIPLENIALFLNISKLIFLSGKHGQESLSAILTLLLKYFPLCDPAWLPIPHTPSTFQSKVLN